MKKIYTILLLSILLSCSFKGDKFIIKKITNNDILIKWYYYSYISNFSPEYIEVYKGDEKILIYESKGIVTDVAIKDRKIYIKLYKPESGIVYTNKFIPNVFDYKIIIDSNATYKEYLSIPDAIKE